MYIKYTQYIHYTQRGINESFRNYENEAINFTNGINLLLGSNAQGKTNAGEAIFYLCTVYSPRVSKESQVINYEKEEAFIKGEAYGNYGKVLVSIGFNRQDKKVVKVNEVQVSRIGELMGNMHSVFFNPGELKIIQDSPEDRRRFLNISLSQMSKAYFYSLNRYNKILAQRNKLLKDENISIIRETLPIWDLQLVKHASKIIKDRNDFLLKISPIAEEKHALLSGGREQLKMKTESGYYGTEEEISYALLQDLKLAMDKDIRLGFTSIGPHRDDIKFTLNGEDVRVYASQGQQRTVALALKLAETEIFYQKFGEYPVLILDDVLSELDNLRQKRLVKAVEGMQTIFTATGKFSTVFKGEKYQKTIIENGKIKSVKKENF